MPTPDNDCTCDLCGRDADELNQAVDWPGIRTAEGLRTAWVCDDCYGEPEETPDA
jgi:hypothetical protein